MEHIFKLVELHNLYEKLLREFGVIKSINKTRLKDQILDQFLGHFAKKKQMVKTHF